MDFGNNRIKDFSIDFKDLTKTYKHHPVTAAGILKEKMRNISEDSDLFRRLGENYTISGKKKTRWIVTGKNNIEYTWEHNLQDKKLYLVERKAHQKARHIGAGSVMSFIKNYFR